MTEVVSASASRAPLSFSWNPARMSSCFSCLHQWRRSFQDRKKLFFCRSSPGLRMSAPVFIWRTRFSWSWFNITCDSFHFNSSQELKRFFDLCGAKRDWNCEIHDATFCIQLNRFPAKQWRLVCISQRGQHRNPRNLEAWIEGLFLKINSSSTCCRVPQEVRVFPELCLVSRDIFSPMFSQWVLLWLHLWLQTCDFFEKHVGDILISWLTATISWGKLLLESAHIQLDSDHLSWHEALCPLLSNTGAPWVCCFLWV